MEKSLILNKQWAYNTNGYLHFGMVNAIETPVDHTVISISFTQMATKCFQFFFFCFEFFSYKVTENKFLIRLLLLQAAVLLFFVKFCNIMRCDKKVHWKPFYTHNILSLLCSAAVVALFQPTFIFEGEKSLDKTFYYEHNNMAHIQNFIYTCSSYVKFNCNLNETSYASSTFFLFSLFRNR